MQIQLQVSWQNCPEKIIKRDLDYSMKPGNAYPEWERLCLPFRNEPLETSGSESNSSRQLFIAGITSEYWGLGVKKEYLFPTGIDTPKKHTLIFQQGHVALWYFMQPPIDPTTPPSQRIPHPVSLADARRLAREVKFERGQMREPGDSEALSMSDCRKRIESFTRSGIFLRGYTEGFQLAMLGFYHIEDTNHPDAARCSFCKRTFLFGMTSQKKKLLFWSLFI